MCKVHFAVAQIVVLVAVSTWGAKTTGLSERVVEKGESMVVRFGVSGEGFVTADKSQMEQVLTT